MNQIKLVIFDVDGLMLDTERVWQTAWQITGEEYGLAHRGTTLFHKVVGRNGKEVEQIIERELSGRCDPLQFLNDARGKGQAMLKEGIQVKPGLYELLDTLDALHIKKAVATVTPREATKQRFLSLNLWDRFDSIVCGDQVTKRKPDPQIYLKVIEALQVEKTAALILEDSYVGVEAAYRAGIACIMVPDIIPASALQKQQTIAIAKNLFEVNALFDQNEEVKGRKIC